MRWTFLTFRKWLSGLIQSFRGSPAYRPAVRPVFRKLRFEVLEERTALAADVFQWTGGNGTFSDSENWVGPPPDVQEVGYPEADDTALYASRGGTIEFTQDAKVALTLVDRGKWKFVPGNAVLDAGALNVSNGRDAQMTIFGATFVFAEISLARQEGGTGDLNLESSESEIDGAVTVRVGQRGTGNLDLKDSDMLMRNGILQIAIGPNASGKVVVGEGSSLVSEPSSSGLKGRKRFSTFPTKADWVPACSRLGKLPRGK